MRTLFSFVFGPTQNRMTDGRKTHGRNPGRLPSVTGQGFVPGFTVMRALVLACGLFIVAGWSPVHAQADNGLTWPRSGSSVSGLVEISGHADHPTFRKWQLDLLLDGDPAQATFLAVGEEPVHTPMALATVDTRRYPDGNHSLRLRVVHSNLNYDEYIVPITVNNRAAGNAGRATTVASLTGAEADKALTVRAADTPAAKPGVPAPKANNRTFTPPPGGRWIEVDISDQSLTAWDGDRIFMQTQISSGRAETPTVAGVFSVERKIERQRMVGPGYDLPNVTSVMYFFLNYAIHAAYWHDDFGNVASHGCVNMRVDEAAALFDWAEVGTPVYVHD